jgi:hypothetical protein
MHYLLITGHFKGSSYPYQSQKNKQQTNKGGRLCHVPMQLPFILYENCTTPYQFVIKRCNINIILQTIIANCSDYIRSQAILYKAKIGMVGKKPTFIFIEVNLLYRK